MQTEKAKIPVRPSVDSTVVLAVSNNNVKQTDATASGAPWETMFRNSGWSCLSERLRVLFLYLKWRIMMAMPTRWPTTVAREDPVIPHPNQEMNTRSSNKLTTLSITMAMDANRGLPSTLIMALHVHIIM